MEPKSLRTSKDPLRETAALFRILARLREKAPNQNIGRREFQEVADCSPRQVQRYINILKGSDLVEYDHARKTYVLTPRGSQFPQLSLETEEALALVIVATLAQRERFPYGKPLTDGMAKVTAGLPSPIRRLARDVAAQLASRPAPSVPAGEVLTDLLEACHQQRVVHMDYTSNRSGRRVRPLHPYGLDIDGRSWYVHGWCPQNRTIRTFHLANLHHLEATGERFERDEAAWAAFKGAGGVFRQWRGGEVIRVEVEFSPEVTSYARRTPWPEGLQLTDTEEGGVLLTGEAQGIEGIVPELLRWRRHVRVLGGGELREAYLSELRAMIALYEERSLYERTPLITNG